MVLDLLILDRESSELEVHVFEFGGDFLELGLELLYTVLAFLLDLAEANDLSLALLELEVGLVELPDELAALLLIVLLRLLGLGQLE